MAQSQSPAFFAVALLLLAAASPLALAQLPPIPLLTPGAPNLLDILDAIQITGVLCCSPTGICIGGPGLGGVNFTMSCRTGTLGSGTGSLIVAQGTTTGTGEFTITLSSIDALLTALGVTVADILAGRLPCQILVALPVSQAVCPALGAANGVLAGALSLIGATLTTALGVVVRFAVNFGVSLP